MGIQLSPPGHLLVLQQARGCCPDTAVTPSFSYANLHGAQRQGAMATTATTGNGQMGPIRVGRGVGFSGIGVGTGMEAH